MNVKARGTLDPGVYEKFYAEVTKLAKPKILLLTPEQHESLRVALELDELPTHFMGGRIVYYE